LRGASPAPQAGDRAIRSNSSTFPLGKSAVFPLLSLALRCAARFHCMAVIARRLGQNLMPRDGGRQEAGPFQGAAPGFGDF
jgi:hypothetical protein